MGSADRAVTHLQYPRADVLINHRLNHFVSKPAACPSAETKLLGACTSDVQPINRTPTYTVLS